MRLAFRCILVLLCLVLGVGAIPLTALGWWTVAGSGSAGATAATLGAPGAPSVSVASPNANLSWTAAAAPGAGVAGYYVERRPAAGTTWSAACGTSAAAPITTAGCTDAPGDGTFVWRVTAVFHSWTTVGAASSSVTVDAISPTGSITAPASGVAVKGTVTVTSDSGDTGSGVASAQFQISPAGAGSWSNLGSADTTAPYSVAWNTSTYADGAYDLRVVTSDHAGLTFTSAAVTNVVADNTTPTVAVALASAPTGAYLSPGNVLYFKANAGGSFGLVATVTDAASGAASASFPALSATGWTTHSSQTVTTPAGGPYASSTFSWASGASAPAAYTVTGANRAGSTTTTGITFAVDSTAPTGTVTAPAASAVVRGTASITSNSADAGSGVASAQFQEAPHGTSTWTNAGAPATTSPYVASWDTTTVSDGLYDLRVITTDNVGTSFTSAAIANIRVDNTAPTGSITAPAASASVRATISVSANSADTGSGVAGALFQRSPAGANTWTDIGTADTSAPYAASWNTTGVSDGLYDLRVVTTDVASNTFTSTTASNVRVDNTAPTGTITTPAASANVSGTISIASNSADTGSGVASALFQRSPAGGNTWTTIGIVDTTSPYAVSWATTGVAAGLYDLRVTTTDVAGNTFTSATVANVRVDNTAPTGSITAPAANAFVNGAAVAVTSNSADGGSGVASAQFQSAPHGTTTWSVIGSADIASPYGVTWNTTAVADGLYDLRVVTTDNAGNAFTSAAVVVEVQNTAPTAASVQLLDGGGTAGMPQQADRIVVTFSQTLRVSSLCSAWSNDLADQILNGGNNVTVTVTDGGVAADTLTLASTSCTFHFGAISLGSTGYAIGGNMTFSGTGANRSTIAWTAATHTLTITLGQKAGAGAAGTVATSAAVYTPDSAIQNALGTAITGTVGTGTIAQF